MNIPQRELPTAVLDTSVLVPEWSRLTLQRLAASPQPRYQPIWSEWIIAETWFVLTRSSVRSGRADARVSAESKAMLRHLLTVMRMVSVAGPAAGRSPSPLRDPDDAPIWATARLGGALYIVSHNTRDFPPLMRYVETTGGQQRLVQRHIYQGVEFLTAIEFVEDVLGRDTAAVLGTPPPLGGIIRSQRSIAPQ